MTSSTKKELSSPKRELAKSHTEYFKGWTIRLPNDQQIEPGPVLQGFYPRFYQLTGFIGLDPKPNFRQYAQFAKNSINGEEEATAKFRRFYDEYFAVLDMTEEFYIESLRKVFMEHHIPRGLMEYRGKKVDFASVEWVRVLTVEGANDHLCPPGQTEAAHGIFSGIPANDKHNHIQEGVGHYGVYSGSKFAAKIFPVIRTHIEG